MLRTASLTDNEYDFGRRPSAAMTSRYDSRPRSIARKMISCSRSLAGAMLGVTLLVQVLPVTASGTVYRRNSITLGATNIFTARTISGLNVRIPRPATFRAGVSSPDIRIRGAGRMAGYVLVQQGVPFEDRISLTTTFSRFCDKPGCRSSEEPFFWHSGRNVPYDPQTKLRTLPAGDYTLYLIADGTPVEVTFRFRGLSGRRAVALTKRADGTVTLPRVRMSVEPTKTAYWFGEEFDLSGSGGVAIMLVRLKGDNLVSSRREGCFYGEDPPPDPLAYAPQCPGAGLGIAVTETNPTTGGYEVIDGYFSEVTPGGRWGLGMNYLAAGEVSEANSLFFYVDVDQSEL